MFGKKRKARIDEVAEVAESDETLQTEESSAAAETDETDPDLTPKELIDDRPSEGPFDFSEVTEIKPYIDFGSVLIPPVPGLTIRVEVEEPAKRPVAITFEREGTQLQVQAFAAPRSEGLWAEVRDQVRAQLDAQKASHRDFDGELGIEIHASVPGGDGATHPVRFIGVDGPRWFLRGVVSGAGLAEEATAVRVNELFRSIVVRRGEDPRAPKELLPLVLPTPDQHGGDDAE